jgi:peptidoglycan/LPS O-acetylase OafA/YrhL
VALGLLFVRLRPAIGPARGGRYWAWGLIELGALAALWATLHFCPWSYGTGGGVSFATRMLTWQGYYLPAFACLVWVGALGRGPLSRVMSWSPLVYLGELSYGVYIFHWPVYELTRNLLGRWGIEMHPYNAAALSGAGTLLISALSYHFWETPIRHLVRGRPKAPVAEEPVGVVPPLPQPERRAA